MEFMQPPLYRGKKRSFTLIRTLRMSQPPSQPHQHPSFLPTQLFWEGTARREGRRGGEISRWGYLTRVLKCEELSLVREEGEAGCREGNKTPSLAASSTLSRRKGKRWRNLERKRISSARTALRTGGCGPFTYDVGKNLRFLRLLSLS